MRWKGMFLSFLGFRLFPPPPFRCDKSAEFLLRPVKLRPSLVMDSKDAQESLESGGGVGARCRCSNGRRKAATVAAAFVIQSLLTAACVALSLSIYLSQQPGSSKTHDKGIYMQMTNPDELEFITLWNQSVTLNDKKRMKLSCGGPYMVYLWACIRDLNPDGVANLTIEIGNKPFNLQTRQRTECKKMQEVIMLNEKNEVTVKTKFFKDNISITELFLGLHYMLGAQCFPSPINKER